MMLLDALTGLTVFRLRAIQKQVRPIVRALPFIAYPFLVLILGLWMWASVGYIAFGNRHPAYFGSFQCSAALKSNSRQLPFEPGRRRYFLDARRGETARIRLVQL